MISQDELKFHIRYYPETGIFIWIKPTGDRIRPGYVAGCKRPDNGYRIIRIKGKIYLSHRLAFLYMTGEIPKFVDHINGVRDDNRWSNLRAVTKSENSKNMATPKTNKSGVIGVCWNSEKQKWTARIKEKQITYHLGHFTKIEDAALARKCAERKFNFHANHGRKTDAEA